MENWQQHPYRIAVDCSTNMIGIAIFSDQQIVTGDKISESKLRSGDKPGHSKLLVRIMNDCMDEFCGGKKGLAAMQEFKPEAILLSNGPGSFTGLRIAVATAKTLGIGLKVPVTTFSSLHYYNFCMAKAAQVHGREVVVLLDAKQKRCYAGFFDESDVWTEVDLNPAELLQRFPDRVFAYNELELTEKYIRHYDEENATNLNGDVWPTVSKKDFFDDDMGVCARHFTDYFNTHLKDLIETDLSSSATDQINLNIAANYLRKPQANLPKAR